MNNQSNTKMIAVGGILVALTVIDLYLTSLITNLSVVLYGLSSLPISIIIMESNKKFALTFYFTTVALGFILVPGKIVMVIYAIILGLYGVIKSYAESKDSRIFEWAVKLGYLNITTAIAYLFVTELLLVNVRFGFSVWIMIIPIEIGFVLYDIIYSQFIYYYLKMIVPKIKNL